MIVSKYAHYVKLRGPQVETFQPYDNVVVFTDSNIPIISISFLWL